MKWTDTPRATLHATTGATPTEAAYGSSLLVLLVTGALVIAGHLI